MRIVTAIVVWIVVLGSITSFLRHRQSQQAGQTTETLPVAQRASAVYSLTVTPTFQAEPDPFALQTTTTDPAPALLVRMAGSDLLRVTDQVQAGRTLYVEALPEVRVGLNEVYIEGSPPTDQSGQRQAILVELFRNGVWVQQASFWSVPGAKVTGTLRFEVTEDEPDHDH